MSPPPPRAQPLLVPLPLVNSSCFTAHHMIKRGEPAGHEPSVWSHKILMDSERKCKIKILVQARAWLGRCLLWDPISGFTVGGPECWAEGPMPAWPVTRQRTRPVEDVGQSSQNQRRCLPSQSFPFFPARTQWVCVWRP